MPNSENVLITGASEGLGKELALCFAKQGYKLILVARTASKLAEVARLCQQLNQQQAVVIELDLAQANAALTLYQRVQELGIDVDILINNAGIGLWGNFAKADKVWQERLLQINLLAVVSLTHLFIKDMLKKNRGKIVNIASVYAYCPVPYQALYAASKAFLLSFGSALSKELESTEIKICTICPGTILTQFRHPVQKNEKPSFFTMTAGQVAKLSYKHIQKGRLIYTPGLVNKLFVFITCLLPMRWLLSVVNWLAYKLRGYKDLQGS